MLLYSFNFAIYLKLEMYSIDNIINYRDLKWNHTRDFFFMTKISTSFESFFITPSYYSYGIITSGKLIIELDGKHLQIDNTNKSFFVCRPDLNFKIIEISDDTEGFFVLFNKDFIRTLDDNYLSIAQKTFLENHFGNYYTLVSKDYERLKQLFSKIFDLLSFLAEDSWSHTAKNMILVLISETDFIISKYKSLSNHVMINKSQEILEKFIQLVSENFLTEQNLIFYTQRLNISSNYLYKIVNNQLKTNPSGIIQKAVLDYSLTLLKNTNLSISEISDKLSFNDVYTFSKFFKKKMIVSPKKYRQQFLINNI